MIAREAVQRAEGEQIRAKSGLGPQLSFSASYDRALASEFEGILDTVPIGPTCPPLSLNPQAPLNTRVRRSNGPSTVAPSAAASSAITVVVSRFHLGRKTRFGRSYPPRTFYSGGRNGAQMAVAAAGHETAALSLTGVGPANP